MAPYLPETAANVAAARVDFISSSRLFRFQPKKINAQRLATFATQSRRKRTLIDGVEKSASFHKRSFWQSRFSQPINKVIAVFCTFQNRYVLLRPDCVFRVHPQDLHGFGARVFYSPKLSIGRGQKSVAILVIGSSARGFAQPALCFAILFEQVIRYSCYQRRKMRMERIEPHLRFRNLNCFGGLPDRIKDLRKSVIREIGV